MSFLPHVRGFPSKPGPHFHMGILSGKCHWFCVCCPVGQLRGHRRRVVQVAGAVPSPSSTPPPPPAPALWSPVLAPNLGSLQRPFSTGVLLLPPAACGFVGGQAGSRLEFGPISLPTILKKGWDAAAPEGGTRAYSVSFKTSLVKGKLRGRERERARKRGACSESRCSLVPLLSFLHRPPGRVPRAGLDQGGEVAGALERGPGVGPF